LEDRAKLREIETIVSTDLLELLVLLCSIIMHQYILQCTVRRVSSATLPLPPITFMQPALNDTFSTNRLHRASILKVKKVNIRPTKKVEKITCWKMRTSRSWEIQKNVKTERRKRHKLRKKN